MAREGTSVEPPDDLEALALVRDGWDGHGAPAPTAEVLGHARAMLADMEAAAIHVGSVRADPEGGAVIGVAVPDASAEAASVSLSNRGTGCGLMHICRDARGPRSEGYPFDPGDPGQRRGVVDRLAAFVADRKVAHYLEDIPRPPPVWPKVVSVLGVGIVWTGAVIAALPLLLMAGGFALQDLGKRALQPRRLK